MQSVLVRNCESARKSSLSAGGNIRIKLRSDQCEQNITLLVLLDIINQFPSSANYVLVDFSLLEFQVYLTVRKLKTENVEINVFTCADI